jgi:hypothetical protein
MTQVDYSKQKGVADEPHWNTFIQEIGGQLVAPLIKRPQIKNADYIFRSEKVIAELKIFETEFSHTPEMLRKIEPIIDKYEHIKSNSDIIKLNRAIIDELKAPLRRIINKANRQIKETKTEINCIDYYGLIICVNDGFKNVPPDIIMYMLGSILNGGYFSNTQSIVYLTNHYIEIPSNPYAVLYWSAVYKNNAPDEIVAFVDDLGRKWHDFTEKLIGPFEFRGETPDGSVVIGSSVVSGILRNKRYVGP